MGLKLRFKVSAIVIALGIVSLFTDASTEMIVPILPLFLVFVLHADYLLIGFIDGLAEVTTNTVRIFSGWCADRFSRRKPFLLFGYGIGAFLKPLMGLSTAWWQIAILRSSERLGKGMRGPPRDALVADATERSIRGRAFGLHRALDTTGALIGSVVALLLVTFLAGVEGDKYRAILILSAIPAVIGFFILLIFVKEAGGCTEKKGLKSSFKSLTREVKLFFLVSTLLSMGATNLSFMILRGADTGFSDHMLILFYILFNLVYALTSYPLGVTSDLTGRRVFLVLGFGIAAVVQVFLAFASVSPVLIVLSFLINGIFMAMTDGMQKAFVVDLTPCDARGTALGIHYALAGASAFTGGVLTGWVWTNYNPCYAFLIPAFILLSGIAGFILIFGIRKKIPTY